MNATSSTAPTISATANTGWPIASFVVAEATAAIRRGTEPEQGVGRATMPRARSPSREGCPPAETPARAASAIRRRDRLGRRRSWPRVWPAGRGTGSSPPSLASTSRASPRRGRRRAPWTSAKPSIGCCVRTVSGAALSSGARPVPAAAGRADLLERGARARSSTVRSKPSADVSRASDRPIWSEGHQRREGDGHGGRPSRSQASGPANPSPRLARASAAARGPARREQGPGGEDQRRA